MLLRQRLVPSCERQDVVAEHAQLGVDNDVTGFVEPVFGANAELLLADTSHREMGGQVDASAQDKTESSIWVGIGSRQQARTRVVHDGPQLDVKVLISTGLLDNSAKILTKQALVSQKRFPHRQQFASTHRCLPVMRQTIFYRGWQGARPDSLLNRKTPCTRNRQRFFSILSVVAILTKSLADVLSHPSEKCHPLQTLDVLINTVAPHADDFTLLVYDDLTTA